MSEMKDVLVRSFIHDLRSKIFSMGADIRLILMGVYGNVSEEIERSLKEAHHKTVLVEKIIHEQFRLMDAFDVDMNNFLEAELDMKNEIIYPALKEFACILEEEEGGASCNLGEKGVRVDLDLPSESLLVKGRKSLLVSVFRNLVGNAVEHGGKGAIRITILAREVDCKYEFVVSNDGNPIEEEIAKKIFREPSLSGGSRGRGLYLIGKIVEMHGGEIYYDDASSVPRFVLTLPKA